MKLCGILSRKETRNIVRFILITNVSTNSEQNNSNVTLLRRISLSQSQSTSCVSTVPFYKLHKVIHLEFTLTKEIFQNL